MKNKNDGLKLDNVIELIRHNERIFIRGYHPKGTNCDCPAEEIPLVCQPTLASGLCETDAQPCSNPPTDC